MAIPKLVFQPPYSILFFMDELTMQPRFFILTATMFLLISCGHFYRTAAKVGRGRKTEAVFIFGDSLVDVGNNNYLPFSRARADFPHYGVDFPGSKPTGRFSNGLNVADFIAQKLGLGNLSPPPYLSIHGIRSTHNFIGANFASGGSGILNETGAVAVQRITLSEQVHDFMKLRGGLLSLLGEERTQHLFMNKSMFVFVIGSNDLIFSYNPSNANKTTLHEFTDLLTSLLKIELQKLYKAGARKFFVSGTGVIGCCPSLRLKSKNGTCNEHKNKLSMAYNEKLYALLSNMSEAISDFKFAFGDPYYMGCKYLKNPHKYGFKDVRKACCGGGRLNAQTPCLPKDHYCQNRREYVFWDWGHPTEIVVRMLVSQFYNGSVAAVRPVNMAELVAAASSSSSP